MGETAHESLRHSWVPHGWWWVVGVLAVMHTTNTHEKSSGTCVYLVLDFINSENW